MDDMNKRMREALEDFGIEGLAQPIKESVEALVESYEFASVAHAADFEQATYESLEHIEKIRAEHGDEMAKGQVLQEWKGQIISIMELFNESSQLVLTDPPGAATALISAQMSVMLMVDAMQAVQSRIVQEQIKSMGLDGIDALMNKIGSTLDGNES